MQNQEINNLYKWGKVVLVLLAIFLGVTALSGLKGLRNPNPAYNVITVSGEGEAFAVPDIASFSFSVSMDAATVSAAQEGVTKKMDAILAQLKDMGIEERDIKTSDYSVYPKYVYGSAPCSMNYCPPSERKQDGYSANHSVSVKVRETEKAGEALAAAGSAGATNLSSIAFTVDDEDKIVAEARALAIKDAKEKAEMLADELGVKLVRVMGYSDNMGGSPVPYYREMSVSATPMMDAQVKTPTLPTGENKVQVTVSVTYEIR
ncbi:MAG: SIMPL domain-containing protein [Patescibacteria group bacterium]